MPRRGPRTLTEAQRTAARTLLAETMAEFKSAYPEPRHADDTVVLERLEKLHRATGTVHQRKDEDTVALRAFAAIQARITGPEEGLIGLLGHAVRTKRLVTEREKHANKAEPIIDATIACVEPLQEFIALLKEEAAAEDKTYWMDYDREPMGLWDKRLEAALKDVTEIIRIRRNLGLTIRQNLHLTQVRAREGNLNFASLAGLRTLVEYLAFSAKGAQQSDIAALAALTLDKAIDFTHVKDARKFLRKQKAEATAAKAKSPKIEGAT